MEFNGEVYHCASRRNVVYATHGMVATGQPLAAQAGLEILKLGGNAVDAAIATAAALSVVEPVSNGIGGDNFALVWMKGQLYGLNSSGPAPRSISIDSLHEQGITEMPAHGLVPVTVPGTPGGWAALSERFGHLPLEEVLAPAIRYAREGYPVSPNAAIQWANAFRIYQQKLTGPEFEGWFTTFAPEGRAPRCGEIVYLPDHATTLERIAQSKAEAFYRGELADQIDEFSRKFNGYLRSSDLAGFKPEWVDPISINYRGYEVWEIPPNGHGIVALMALNILKGFEIKDRNNLTTFHQQIEALKLAYADGLKYVADPKSMTVTPVQLLNEAYAKERREQITNEALMPFPGKPEGAGTVYLATADGEGNMVSMIQSNYMGFGSGIVVPGTGIALHNRGHNFTMEEGHANALAGGKKPYHTIIPGFLTKDGAAIGPFGVMGGFMQPQGHLQVLMNTIDFKMNPQDALDAPRWQWVGGKTIQVEPDFPAQFAKDLADMGHDIQVQKNTADFGRGEIIWRNEQGVLCGGTEPRTDGCIAAY